MTGPTHLWSGDWESESARTADDLANAPAPVFDPEPEPEPEPRAARPWSRRQMAVALTTGVAAAAIAVVLVSAFTDGSNGPKAHKLAAAPTVHAQRPTGGAAPTTPAACKQTPAACAQVTPAVAGPTADWMGMQIVSSPAGVVISTVRVGSVADQAGFEPGDQIEEIDGIQVNDMDQIREATAALALGKLVSMKVLRDSVLVQAGSMRMTERPTIHP